MCEKAFDSDRLDELLYSKHFKRTYAGKPTKRFLKLMQKINKSEIMNGCNEEQLLDKLQFRKKLV
jgi:hypothetical protein